VSAAPSAEIARASPTGPAPATSPAQALWRLARPSGVVFVMLLPLVGYGFGLWDRALPLRRAGDLGLVLAAWAALHAGALWLNAALDRDDGPVLWGSAPVGVPASVVPAGYAALTLSVVVALAADPVPGALAAACATLAVLYSHPRTRWKGHPIGGPLVNVVGYALLSPVAGWWLADVAVDARTALVFALFVPWIVGTYCLAQSFQGDEDRARGYRTLVVTHGERAALWGARLGFGVTAIGFAALAVAGWVPRLAALSIVPWWLVERRLAGVRRPSHADVADVFRRLVVYGVTLFGLVLGVHLVHVVRDEPTAGLATAAGRPADREWVRQLRLRR
jgi:4-hydroxybenzoate polyprenyltransferase